MRPPRPNQSQWPRRSLRLPRSLRRRRWTSTQKPHRPRPSVRRLARELGLDINDVAGSGPGGHISEQDVMQHAAG